MTHEKVESLYQEVLDFIKNPAGDADEIQMKLRLLKEAGQEQVAPNQFRKMGKIGRWSREVLVTEKIDGTNAQIYFLEDGKMLTGSKNRWIQPGNDNAGFSHWAHTHEDELREILGPGRHYGEWFGNKIQRTYGMPNKQFALFDHVRYGHIDFAHESVRGIGLCMVPILFRGNMDNLNVKSLMQSLLESGSQIDFHQPVTKHVNPEGIVIAHLATGALFKKTFLKDEGGKEA